MPTTNLQKFFLLSWKNWLLQYRRPIQTILEIFSPILFSVLLVFIRAKVVRTKFDGKTFMPFCPIPQANFNFTPLVCTEEPSEVPNVGPFYYKYWDLIYSPNSPALENALQVFTFYFRRVIAVENSQELTGKVTVNNETEYFCVLEFPDSYKSLKNFSSVDNFTVKIRFPGELRHWTDPKDNWRTNTIYPSFKEPGPREYKLEHGGTPGYFFEFFLGMQHMVTIALIAAKKDIYGEEINEWMESEPIPTISMQRFPHSAWYKDQLLKYMQYMLSMILMLSFVYSCINMVRSITTEKERQLKETMKIMGLSNWLHWSAWFVKFFICLLISASLIVGLLNINWFTRTNSTVFTRADPTVILFFLAFYISATCTLCFALSVMFDKANTAAAVSGMIWFASYLPYVVMSRKYERLRLREKIAGCILSNSAMGLGFQLMLMFEGTGEGVHWNNLFRPPSPDDNLTLGYIIIMLFIDTILYWLIALYVEAVFPGEYGVPKPWYFFATPRYWKGPPSGPISDDSDVSIFYRPTNEGDFFEAEPTSLQAGVQITNLRKVFHNRAAVKDLNLNMYEDQITVLLGHNGAGKTTVMSILTGMIRPTSGTAKVNGFDIRSEIEGVRQSLGLCPQHNIIFDKLTVEEHLYFFSRLKGLSKPEIKKEIDKYLKLLELEDKRKSKSSTLSGGMKRKLCVGIALCGNSRVVMLDEPTAGMDPSARRALWKLLKSQKEGRTILLSTHFMDEADLLGDRIAIMARGSLRCCGSSFFLKKKYGAGYSLILDKSPDCDPVQVTALLQNHIPSIEVHSNVGSELTYLLMENQSSKFEPMLKDLENNSKRLKINSYGISLTTMEEVFMKVGADNGQIGNLEAEEKFNRDETLQLGVRPDYHGGIRLIGNQFKAMFLKRAVSSYRSWLLLLLQFLIPAAHVIFAVMTKRSSALMSDLPGLPLTLDMFDRPITLIETVPHSTHVATYLRMLKGQKGVYELTKSVPGRFLEVVSKRPLKATMNYVVGATFDEIDGREHITVWFNNNPYHTPGVSLALVLNAIYKKHLECSNCSIEFHNAPMMYPVTFKHTQLYSEAALGFQLCLNLGFGMSFVSSFYILFIIKENVSKSKHLQFVSGVRLSIFWLTTAVWDMLTFMVTIFSILITLAFFKEDGYRRSTDLGLLLLSFFVFSWSFLPLYYIAAHFCKAPASGYTKMTIFGAFTGITGFLLINLTNFEEYGVQHISETLEKFFMFFPHYNLVRCIGNQFDFYANEELCQRCKKEHCYPALLEYLCKYANKSYFMWETPGLGQYLTYSAIMGLVYYIVLILIEIELFARIMAWCRERRGRQSQYEEENKDPDVAEEKQKIRETQQEDLIKEYTLVLRDLTKYYKKFLAVDQLCLAVKEYECFGLLGVNGAGKTTTFKMMTGDVKVGSGEGWVNGYSIRNQLKKVQESIGYCPQFDALLSHMTVKETIVMFALLRGIRGSECDKLVETLSKEFDFVRHLNKKIKALSGGNKRKVSTAIAVIGDPPVIYLDEPTTGMDPATKRYLWNALCKIRDSGKCVILTSHSMEECEALCTRLAIMVNGNFQCIGSSQHLKNKFAKGYNLSIKLKKRGEGDLAQYETGPVEKFINTQFPKAHLREKHEELLNYYIRDVSRPWSEMFGILEKAKQSGIYDMEDYSLGQGSLEQVFLSFTRMQK